jgi:hypothetical protein
MQPLTVHRFGACSWCINRKIGAKQAAQIGFRRGISGTPFGNHLKTCHAGGRGLESLHPRWSGPPRGACPWRFTRHRARTRSSPWRLNGYDAVGRLRQQQRGKRMLVIAMTGWGQDDDKRRAAEAGFNPSLHQAARRRRAFQSARDADPASTSMSTESRRRTLC